MNRACLFCAALLIGTLAETVHAQIPRVLSYQGVLSDTLGNPKPDGVYSFTFRLYESRDGGSAIWSEQQSLQLKRGLFNATLGELTPFGSAVQFDRRYWLSVQIGADPELWPPLGLTAVGYSLNAVKADSAQFVQNAVLSLNGLTDRVTLAGRNGATIATSADTVYVDAAGSGNGVSGTGQAGQLAFWSNVSSLSGDRSLFWDNMQQRLGLGTSQPERVFHLSSSLSAWGMMLLENSSTGFNEASIGFKPGSDATAADIWVAGVGCWDTPNSFVLGRNGPRMTLHPDGRLGLGTTSPQQQIHVYGTANPRILVEAPDYTTPEFNLRRGQANYNIYLSPSYDLTFYSTGPKMTLTEGGSLGIGTSTPEERLHVAGAVKCGVLKLTGGSDIAERFDITSTTEVEPGMVVSIDTAHPGRLRIATTAYDHCVAGIVSGAGGVSPGLTLAQESTVADGTHPVAMTGRVYCRATATNGAIRPGDLLTTSDIPGYAMKATERDRSIGATLGKAMSSLNSNEGLVLILVSLQ